MLALVLLELSFKDVVSDLPHDAGALVTYLLLGLFVAFIWVGSSGQGKSPRDGAGPRS